MSIELRDVSYVYMPGTPYERTALKNVSLTVEQGEFIGVIGHTGSGKSTLVQNMNGLLKPSRGTVAVDGADLAAKGEAARLARRKVGMVFQYPEHQLFEETVFDDVAFGPRNLGLAADEMEERVRLALDFVGLDFAAFAKRSPFRLSGGQMRRVAIAGVVALQPSYLILDEPSAGLDPRGRDEIFSEVVRLHETTGVTVVLISHNMEEVARLVKRLVVMHDGAVSLDGPPREIFRHAAELKAAGVAVPGVTALMARLAGRGLDVDAAALTVEEAAASIAAAVRRRGAC
ncbi:energy-coupling factor transporter ATPase [Anaeroselena agilis]|uniref:Energy-coupling factor transporter ATP-binding protein EcfA2 n=1 Tax=Anaeroselena agilis TaxID=3063788 RepID=A0ABU3P0T8_9FIRM|nr:energy-coupling factor transporter ATPase [Selenomonadales bacterium 4137-cl]